MEPSLTWLELLDDAAGRAMWHDAEHCAWAAFLVALDLSPAEFCSLMRRSFEAERSSVVLSSRLLRS